MQNNLYGVDINEEAIEICRLSLWIKTASRGKMLTSLDHNIRVGNSVVDDCQVHPKAFDWRTAFPEVFSPRPPAVLGRMGEGQGVRDGDGGFDVIVANPPYIRQEWLAPYKAYWQTRFKSYAGMADIFTYFYELGVELLREGGRLGFITSGSWVRGNYAAPLRKYLADCAKLESMIDFGEFQPFEGAEMIRPTIAVFSKRPPAGSTRLFKWLTAGSPPENLSDVIAAAPLMDTGHLGADAWELESDDVRALRSKMLAGHPSLKDVADGRLFRGVITGLTEVFVIDTPTRDALVSIDPNTVRILKPFLRGQDIRPWSPDWAGLWIITIPSSGDRAWPWSESGADAETVFRDTFPGVYGHLEPHREALTKRQDQGRFWWELRSCAYWDAFDAEKIIWPDIAKLPRFCMDRSSRCMGNTGYFVAKGDDYLLGILASWATWFLISKTAQPLRLRGDRWQYRLFTQFMEQMPIPEADTEEERAIGKLAAECNSCGEKLYELQNQVRRRLRTTFGHVASDAPLGDLNQKADAWWESSLQQLGAALKVSFKLPGDPFKNPRTADDWEPYLAEKQALVHRLVGELADAEAELNDRVYRLFNLTADEIQLLQREVEH